MQCLPKATEVPQNGCSAEAVHHPATGSHPQLGTHLHCANMATLCFSPVSTPASVSGTFPRQHSLKPLYRKDRVALWCCRTDSLCHSAQASPVFPKLKGSLSQFLLPFPRTKYNVMQLPAPRPGSCSRVPPASLSPRRLWCSGRRGQRGLGNRWHREGNQRVIRWPSLPCGWWATGRVTGIFCEVPVGFSDLLNNSNN